MTTIHPRLFSLFETLVAAQADWLVFEIMEGIRAGVVDEEGEADLASARRQSDQSSQGRRQEGAEEGYLEIIPLQGDAQIKWAAQYVGDRLREALMMLDMSIGRLNDLSGLAQGRGQAGIVPAFLDIDRLTRCAPAQLNEAMSEIATLIDGLDEWARGAADEEVAS